MNWQALADYCRHANMGYRDGSPGTLEDVETRLSALERFARQDGRVISRFMSNPAITALAREMEPTRDEYPEGSGPYGF